MLKVTTHIALRISGVDFSNGMERLMKITNIVNDHAKGEGSLVFNLGELLCNSCDIGRSGRVNLTSQEGTQISQSVDDIVDRLNEVEVINCGVWLVQDWLVDEVPLVLKVAKSSFDLISEGGTLSHGVVKLGDDVIGVIGLEHSKLSYNFFDDFWACLRVKNLLSSSCD